MKIKLELLTIQNFEEGAIVVSVPKDWVYTEETKRWYAEEKIRQEEALKATIYGMANPRWAVSYGSNTIGPLQTNGYQIKQPTMVQYKSTSTPFHQSHKNNQAYYEYKPEQKIINTKPLSVFVTKYKKKMEFHHEAIDILDHFVAIPSPAFLKERLHLKEQFNKPNVDIESWDEYDTTMAEIFQSACVHLIDEDSRIIENFYDFLDVLCIIKQECQKQDAL